MLADRVGIIDHGRIVAEGTPAALKAEIGRPSVEAVPREPRRPQAIAGVLARFGEPTGATPNGVAVRLRERADGLADIVRALDGEGLELAHLQLHARRSTTSSSRRPGARSKAPPRSTAEPEPAHA